MFSRPPTGRAFVHQAKIKSASARPLIPSGPFLSRMLDLVRFAYDTYRRSGSSRGSPAMVLRFGYRLGDMVVSYPHSRPPTRPCQYGYLHPRRFEPPYAGVLNTRSAGTTRLPTRIAKPTAFCRWDLRPLHFQNLFGHRNHSEAASNSGWTALRQVLRIYTEIPAQSLNRTSSPSIHVAQAGQNEVGI